MKKFKIQNSKFKIIISLLLSTAMIFLFGCQKVEKPSREGTGPMAIIIDMDEAPESHTESKTSEGEVLVNPYSKIPVLGGMFKSSLTGLNWWKANHPNLISGTADPALMADEDETCLDCHDQSTSCNNCHNYVGVNLVTSSDEDEE